jgi:hypothetical protein
MENESRNYFDEMAAEYEEQEARKSSIVYDFGKLGLESCQAIDPKRGPVTMYVDPEDMKGFQSLCYTQQVQIAPYIMVTETGAVVKDKRRDLYLERKLHLKKNNKS